MPKITIFSDTHVHIRKRFDTSKVLDAAYENFRDAASKKQAEDWIGVLMLTESATERAFEELTALIGPAGRTEKLEGWGDWQAMLCADGTAIRLVPIGRKEDLAKEASKDSAVLYIVAGRQIDTAERLEVSALGSDSFIPDGYPIDKVLEIAESNGTYQILPWAPGKWSLSRGRKVKALMLEHGSSRFGLGDNGGRPSIWPRSRMMRAAEQLGIPVLPGSDPLPFDSELYRIGSYGVVLEGYLDPLAPSQSILALLRALDGKPEIYGRLNSAYSFFSNEVRMQLTKKARKRAASARKA